MIVFCFQTSEAELAFQPFMIVTLRGPYQTPLLFLSVFSSLSSSSCQFPCDPNQPLSHVFAVFYYLWIHVKNVGWFCIQVLNLYRVLCINSFLPSLLFLLKTILKVSLQCCMCRSFIVSNTCFLEFHIVNESLLLG